MRPKFYFFTFCTVYCNCVSADVVENVFKRLEERRGTYDPTYPTSMNLPVADDLVKNVSFYSFLIKTFLGHDFHRKKDFKLIIQIGLYLLAFVIFILFFLCCCCFFMQESFKLKFKLRVSKSKVSNLKSFCLWALGAAFV